MLTEKPNTERDFFSPTDPASMTTYTQDLALAHQLWPQIAPSRHERTAQEASAPWPDHLGFKLSELPIVRHAANRKKNGKKGFQEINTCYLNWVHCQ